jgi:hypothetical protein
MNPLTRLRLLLAQEKTALRTATDDYKVIKARAEQRAIESGVNGRNAEERERNLLVALDADAAYQTVLITLRQVESDIDRTEAQIESLLDDRRSYEWAIRSALVDALGGAGKDDGAAFDEVGLGEVVNRLDAIAADRHELYRDVAREMINAYNSGMAERVNGAGEYEVDDPDAGLDPDPDADYQADLQAERYASNFSATLRRQYPPAGDASLELADAMAFAQQNGVTDDDWYKQD